MRVPLSWLKDFTPLDVDPHDAARVSELGRAFDSLGLVVEEIIPVTNDLPAIVVAAVLEISPIPGADRIRRVLVDAGAALGTLEIVCGAWNFEVGDRVPLAPVGAVLPNGMQIARREMRGVTSNGMLCSTSELGLGEDAAGLMILARAGQQIAGVEPGASVASLLCHDDDVIYDLAIEPNRPDCMSIAGVARDIAAHLGLPFQIAEPVVQESDEQIDVVVRSEERDACPQILGRVLTGVSSFPSKALVRRRLELYGMRPINAVVDASNYAMAELGQPNHTYDLDRLTRPGLVVRFAKDGEVLRTLDGSDQRLTVDDLLIADGADQPIGLAGVMGGESSEIGSETTRLLIECAQFAPLVVGKGAARHGLRTEASMRFWRGIDPLGLERCANRVIELIQSGARAAGAAVPLATRAIAADRPAPYRPLEVRVDLERVNTVIGTAFDAAQIRALLEPIGFGVSESDNAVVVSVPSFRPDVRRDVDVIEDIARHHGYENIAGRDRRSPFVGALSPLQAERRRLVRALQGFEADEAWTPSIVEPANDERLKTADRAVVVANPIVAGESVLRTHLLPGLINALRHNEGQNNPYLRLFEIGHVFRLGDAEPLEDEHVGVLLAGRDDDATTAVALWRGVIDSLGIDETSVVIDQREQTRGPSSLAAGLHPSRAGALVDRATNGIVGAIGEVDPDLLESFGVTRRRVGWLVAHVPSLFALAKRSDLAAPISKYPPSDIDLAFSLPEDVPAAQLQSVITDAAGSLLESCTLIDVYRGPGLASGVRSLAFRLRLRARDHTLVEDEIDLARRSVIEAAEAATPARLRS
jgi:phenylalanyl-tRNA synthetase beta chain